MEDIQLTALLPGDMAVVQKDLINWCARKISTLKADEQEMEQSITHAAAMKWKTSPLKTAQAKIKKQIIYYDKIKAALEQGYVIVPNFPVQMFAIRTDRENPLQKFEWYYWGAKEQSPKLLPAGEGEYKNPFPLIERQESVKDKDGKIIEEGYSRAVDWDDLEFPITMIKPEIIQATNQAMALNIFDQFGVMPATRNDDPVIVGQIINGRKRVSFMIAWHLNTKDL